MNQYQMIAEPVARNRLKHDCLIKITMHLRQPDVKVREAASFAGDYTEAMSNWQSEIASQEMNCR
jgi:hypothetical protein